VLTDRGWCESAKVTFERRLAKYAHAFFAALVGLGPVARDNGAFRGWRMIVDGRPTSGAACT